MTSSPNTHTLASAATRLGTDQEASQTTLTWKDLVCGYGSKRIVHGVSHSFRAGAVTGIIGPNGCGKSTALKATARVLTPMSGGAYVGSDVVHRSGRREIAQRIAMLAQHNTAPAGLTVEELIKHGRFPHRTPWSSWSSDDRDAVESAIERTHVDDMRHDMVDEILGGQRQRVMLAMVLAQSTPIVLLDEPRTYLDIAHRVALLNLARTIAGEGKTVVAVLHDLGEACRYCDEIVVMCQGDIYAAGKPEDVMTSKLMDEVFGLEAQVTTDPVSGTPHIVAV